MTPERNRSTIVHELAHLMFVWPESMDDKEIEKMATAIGGAFLFPESDTKRELGIRRSAITKDMVLVAVEDQREWYRKEQFQNNVRQTSGIFRNSRKMSDFYILSARFALVSLVYILLHRDKSKFIVSRIIIRCRQRSDLGRQFSLYDMIEILWMYLRRESRR